MRKRELETENILIAWLNVLFRKLKEKLLSFICVDSVFIVFLIATTEYLTKNKAKRLWWNGLLWLALRE